VGIAQQPLLGQQGGQRDGPEAGAAVTQEVPAIQEPAAGVAESAFCHVGCLCSNFSNQRRQSVNASKSIETFSLALTAMNKEQESF